MFFYLVFLSCLLLCLLIFYGSRHKSTSQLSCSNPNFVEFQKAFFVAYLTALFADWLQSPYLYKLYSHYGFEEDQIAVLYVCGFASTVLLGSWAPTVADRFGRKKLCIIFTIIYLLSSLMTMSSSYFVLVVARILGGVATSLLFSAFESWYLHEHVETHDFPKEWIQETFEKVHFLNGFLAIFAGVLANALVEWFRLGPVSPFILAAPFLLVAGILISVNWTENQSSTKVKIHKSCMDGLRDIIQEPKIFLAGIVQALFESTIYIFVFIWTPVLDKAQPPLGLIFACFMASTAIGSGSFELLRHRGVSVVILLASSVNLAIIGNIICVIASHPEYPRHWLALFGFLIIEFSVGIYFKSMTVIRARLLPQATRNAINSFFRVPLNLIACIILMCLHNDYFRHGNRLIFTLCTALLVLASVCLTFFISMVRRDEDLADLATTDAECSVNAEDN